MEDVRRRFKKMKILGAKCWLITITNTIQLGERFYWRWYGWRFAHSDGNPNVLYANRDNDGQWGNTNWDKPDNQWDDNGAFAFLVPATLFISRPRRTARARFASSTVRSNRRASCPLPQAGGRALHISSYQATWSPRARGAILSACRACG